MSEYKAVHANPQGPGDARPTALQIVKDEGMENKLKGKVIVITGTSSGIGIETARALSVTGASLILTARDLSKAKTALADFFDPKWMNLVEMDQSSLQSVRTAAETIMAKVKHINILICNAGIMAVPDLQFTKDGHESQFGTNHLSHFLFFQLLKPALLAAATPELSSRVVMVSSSNHTLSSINDSDNYDFQKGGYNAWVAYAQSKTANIYMANEIERRYGSQNLHATSLHPGGIMTGLSKFLTTKDIEDFTNNPDLMKILKSPEQGAATTVWAAIGKEWEHKGGKYLIDCGEAEPAKEANTHSAGYGKHVYDQKPATRLWEDSMKIVGLA